MKKLTLLTSAAVMAIAGLSAPALAQDGSAPEPGASSARTSDVITVTARRREESLLDAPVAVSAFGEDDIRKLGIESVDDVARFTPGLSFSAAFGRTTERPVVRGQSNVLAGVQFGVESGTAYFLDGIYYSGPISALDPNDLERVEVIKGPQSALYGRNTYAGAINYVTRGGTDEFEADLRLRAGSHDEREIAARVSGPLVADRLGYSISARHYEYGGEHTNLVTGEKVGQESSFNLSGTIEASFTPNWDVRLRGMYFKDDDGTLPIFLQPSEANNCSQGWASLSRYPLSGSTNDNQYFCGVIQPAPVQLNTGPGPIIPVDGVPPNAILPFLGSPYSTADGTAFDGLERDGVMGSVQSSWDIGGSGYVLEASASSWTQDRKFGTDSDHTSVNWFASGPGSEAFFALTERKEQGDYSFEAKLSSPVDRAFRWMIGAFYYDFEETTYDLTFASPEIGDLTTNVGTTNQAIFGLIEYDLMPNLTATLEARWAEEEKTRTEFGAGGAVSLEQEGTFDSFTPRFTIDWQTDMGLIYAVYAQGVKPGGLNGSLGAGVGSDVYEQEESDNYELGYKNTLLGGDAVLTAAGFFIEASDVQVTRAVSALGGGGATSIAVNQGAAEIWGLELAWNHSPVDFFNYGVTYAWTNPEFTEGCDDFQWTLTSGGGVLDPGSTAPGTGTEFFGQTGNCDISGKQLPLTSEHQFAAFGEFRAPLGGGWEWFAQSDLTYESSKYVQVHNLAETGDTTLIGARLGVETESMTFSLWGRNIGDEDSIIMATRWGQTPYHNLGALSTSPDIAPPGAARGFLPTRAFFANLRRGPAYGVEARLRF
ncbi:MAG: TonB-dependent receptor plug domain-containing protein [Oceanicaulis sp.]